MLISRRCHLTPFAAMCLLIGCKPDAVVEPGRDYDPRLVFEKVIASPIPASVTNLQALAETWQGYGVWARFDCSAADANGIIAAQGFKPVSWSDVALHAFPANEHGRFTPKWSPATAAKPTCYSAQGVRNAWTHSGFHYLVIDSATGQVHFFGRGS